MRADVFFPRMIRVVIAIGLASAFLVVGEDMMAPEVEESRVASSDGADKDAPLVDPSSLVPPTNGTDGSGGSASSILVLALA